MRWKIYICDDCELGFALDDFVRSPSCPNCVSENLTETGEMFLSSDIQPWKELEDL